MCEWEGGRREGPGFLPFVVTELVAVVIRGDDVDQQDVLGLGVHACDFYLVAGEHPPGGSREMTQRRGQSTRRGGTEWVRGQKALRGTASLARDLGTGQSFVTLGTLLPSLVSLPLYKERAARAAPSEPLQSSVCGCEQLKHRDPSQDVREGLNPNQAALISLLSVIHTQRKFWGGGGGGITGAQS